MLNSPSRRNLLFGSVALALAAPHVAHAAPRVVKLGHNSIETSPLADFALNIEPIIADGMQASSHANRGDTNLGP